MFTFALLCAAAGHDPTPDDLYRFGFFRVPVGESIVRKMWQSTVADVTNAQIDPAQEIMLFESEKQAIREQIAYLKWRERCWDALDDLAILGNSEEYKFAACVRLRAKLGPVDYYLGLMP